MDDTLISNQILFEDSKEVLHPLYAELDQQGRSLAEIAELHVTVDSDNIASMGYTPERWHFSAQQVAAIVAGRSLTFDESARVREAAEIALGTGEILDGVEQTLDALAGAGVEMVLKTKGCEVKQAEKLAEHRFDRFFGERIVVVERKDEGSFAEITTRFGLRAPVSIGDSERSDVAPALANGFEAILIDKGAGAWAFEATGADGAEFPRVGSFPEALAHLIAD